LSQSNAPSRQLAPPKRNGRRSIVIGLLNNMSDGALQATEDQFSGLLREAAPPGADLSVRYFSLSEVERGEAARANMRDRYEHPNSLFQTPIDGLIVTGAEPRAERLESETYWPSLAKVIDWTQAERVPTIWSCLAAHAAVARLKGVSRRRLPSKLSGLFALRSADKHPLLQGAPSWPVAPHSRLNDLTACEIEDAGYEILASSPDVGVDTFVGRGQALNIFFQGHPEYDAGALAREYLRDVSRYLRGQQAYLPTTPAGYFDQGTSQRLQSLSSRANLDHRVELLDQFTEVVRSSAPQSSWRPWALHMYRQWLRSVSGLAPIGPASLEAAPERSV
jgi:homoserine O-succinyltransferase